MKFKSLVSALSIAALMTACSGNVEQTASYSVIPQPQHVALNSENGNFMLNGKTVIAYTAGNEQLKNNAGLLKEYLRQLTGHDLKVTETIPESDAIVLLADLQGENEEGYEITINPQLIIINGVTPAGNFYGVQTLRKSIPEAVKSDVAFPAVTISDEPRFSYRGAHFDVSRHFFPADSVKTFIDMLALHNINRFHWHLTDDQGWRIEIKSLPELAEKGSYRSGTVIGHNSGEYDSIPVQGYYTQDQIKDIIDYAAQRYITIIPEIDLPGHMLGALAAYPELGCTGGPYEVWQQWGVSEDVLCAGNDSTYVFIDKVLDEVADLFPGEYVHIGGDECPKSRWEECVVCQAKIKELGLKSDNHSSKEQKLQSHVIKHASDFLASKGKKIIGWDEILEGGLAPGATVMSWRGEEGAVEAAKSGHDAILTPTSHFYFDYFQTLDWDNEPDAFYGYVPIEKVYSYEPIPAALSPEEAKHILGVQANLWTEYIPTFRQAQYMELPRMAALSELQWSSAPKDYNGFTKRLPQLMNQYDANGYNYSTRVFDLEGSYTTDFDNHKVVAAISTADDAPVHYTLDGSEPSSSSPVYEAPIEIGETATLKAAAIHNDKPGRIYTQNINFNKATAHPITLENAPHSRYTEKGAATLVDGINGGKAFNTGGWVGFNGADLVANIDLEKSETVKEVSVNTTVDVGSWIFDARGMKVEVSQDGNNWTTVAEEAYPALEGPMKETVKHTLNFQPVDTRFVKVTLLAEKQMPAWFDVHRKPAFLFADEITIL